MHSCDLLIDSLNKYEGTLLLVSHDRYFVSKTANKIWEIVDGEIKEFKGGYEEWVQWKQRMAKPDSANNKSKSKPVAEPANPKPAATAEPVQQQAPIDKEKKKELQRIQKEFQQLEIQLAELKKQKEQLEADLASPAIYSDKLKFQSAEKAYQQASQQWESANSRYEQVFEKMMELQG
jgi:ATP-binding cassette subfamily F protein 3